MKYIAAEATELFIGNLHFDAIRIIATGEYRMAQKQILESVNVDRFWIQNMVEALQHKRSKPTNQQECFIKAFKTLQGMGLTMFPISVKYQKLDKRNKNITVTSESLSLSDTRILWRYFDKQSNSQASVLIDALTDDSLRDRFDQVYNKSRATVKERREQDTRILDKKCAWKRLYDKQMCYRAFGWFGANFYWQYFYFWMTPEERAKLEVVNPAINGKRKDKIHQWLDEDTKERLKPRANEMCLLLQMSPSRDEFLKNYSKAYGQGWQTDLF